VREVIGLDIEVESDSFWVEFLRALKKRGLAGRKQAIALVLACACNRLVVGRKPGPDRPYPAKKSPLTRRGQLHEVLDVARNWVIVRWNLFSMGRLG
jgi:hypothetical protein